MLIRLRLVRRKLILSKVSIVFTLCFNNSMIGSYFCKSILMFNLKELGSGKVSKSCKCLSIVGSRWKIIILKHWRLKNLQIWLLIHQIYHPFNNELKDFIIDKRRKNFYIIKG